MSACRLYIITIIHIYTHVNIYIYMTQEFPNCAIFRVSGTIVLHILKGNHITSEKKECGKYAREKF